jgi:uncharacterized protein (UPF0548 family)
MVVVLKVVQATAIAVLAFGRLDGDAAESWEMLEVEETDGDTGLPHIASVHSWVVPVLLIAVNSSSGHVGVEDRSCFLESIEMCGWL